MSIDNPHFHIQPVLSDLYHTKDLLDFSAGPSSPPINSNPFPAVASSSPSLFTSATSIAAAAGRRAAAVATAAASPSSQHSARIASPDRSGAQYDQSSQKEIRCVEGYGTNLYIGGSDGVIEWWVCDGSANLGEPLQNDGWVIRHRHTLFPRRPVHRMYALPKVAKLLVISDGTLHVLALPQLDVIPSNIIPPLRGVVSVILNDDELDWAGPGADEKGLEMTVVVVRRKGLGIYKLGTRLTSVKEIPLPSAPTYHALFQNYLCAAIPSDNPTYSIIDLSDASLTEVLPVSQIDTSIEEFDPNPNVVVIPGEDEFLVTSYTGSSTMGVFLNGQGDPVRGTMEWPAHPLSIAIESGYVIALLRNSTTVVHSLADLDQPAQVLILDPAFDAFSLSYSPYGVTMRDTVRDSRMAMTPITLLGGKLAPPEPIAAKTPAPDLGVSPGSEAPVSPDLAETSMLMDEPAGGSGLTPPSTPFQSRHPSYITPQKGSSSHSQGSKPFSTAVAETLVIGPNGIQAIAPTPTLLRLERLCSERHLDEAIALVDEERRRGRRGEVDTDKATHHATLKLLHLYLAAHLFQEAMFERAGDYFSRGKVDPRLVVRSYSHLRGKVIGSAEEVDVYDGLREVLADMPMVEEIITTSIRRNYSPHVQPNSATAPETTALRTALEQEANDMLTEVLRRTRTTRRKGGGARGVDSRKIDIVVDTTLAKLLADKGTTNELLALLASSNDCVLSELEPFLAQRPYVLSTVMRQQGRVDRVLELLKGIADSATPDPFCDDPIDELAQQLETVKDPQLFLRYALWLVEKNLERGLSILMAQNSKTGVRLDDGQLIDDLRKINSDAADRYLEHVVVNKRSPNKTLHEALLSHFLEVVEELVQDDGVKYHLEELDAEYRLESEPRPFCVFFAIIAPDTPIKQVRLKLLLFLQGSPFYDLEQAAKRLEGVTLLKPELAVIYGRLGKHREALHLLAREIGDSLSAQAYCTQGGEVIPPRIARLVSSAAKDTETLKPWAALGEVGRRKKEVREDVRQDLVKELLGVYMRDGRENSKQAAALLNAQSVHLDMPEVLELMPDEWPVDVVSTFFQRSLRRSLHDRASWRILKAISAGENLEVSEKYLDKVSTIPPTIRHGSNSSSALTLPDEGSIPEKEWESYDEKSQDADDFDLQPVENKEGYAADEKDNVVSPQLGMGRREIS